MGDSGTWGFPIDATKIVAEDFDDNCDGNMPDSPNSGIDDYLIED